MDVRPRPAVLYIPNRFHNRPSSFCARFIQGTQLYAGTDFEDFANLYGPVSRVVSLEFSISQRIC